jgi:hypothetical protein
VRADRDHPIPAGKQNYQLPVVFLSSRLRYLCAEVDLRQLNAGLSFFDHFHNI